MRPSLSTVGNGNTKERFERAGLMALLGSGFDPGVTNVFTAWLAKHHFDRMDTLDILDCNGGIMDILLPPILIQRLISEK